MRHVDRDVVFCRQVGEDLCDVIDRAIEVFFDAVALHERVDHDEVDAVGNNLGLKIGRQLSMDGATVLVGRHELAAAGAWRGQEQPFVDFGRRDVEMHARGQDAAAQFVGVVLERNDQDAGALEHVLAGQVAAGCERERLRIAHRSLADPAIAEQRT
jgi:hypothetical protein